MSQPLEQAGSFRGEIYYYAVKNEASGAVAIVVHATIHEVWNPDTKEWEDWRRYEFDVVGYQYVITKTGAANKRTVTALVMHTGWDGNLESVSAGTWTPLPCQFSVEENEYKGKSSYRISWINAYDSAPGSGSVSPEKARQLQNKFGSQLRAIAGDAVRNSMTPKAPEPAAPTAAAATPSMTPKTAPAEPKQPDEIPF
jgi:hypothetical protein